MTEYVTLDDALLVAQEFGFHVRDHGLLASALARPATTVFGADAYPSLDRKAAALLESVVKNHPFFDGNKRSGAFLFLWYLRLNAPLLGKPVEQLITDNTLVALALLVAESLPAQKDLIIRLIEHFIPLREG